MKVFHRRFFCLLSLTSHFEKFWDCFCAWQELQQRQRREFGGKIDLLTAEKRKNCARCAIPTIDQSSLDVILRLSTVFCVGI
jgi:hypothetical protein